MNTTNKMVMGLALVSCLTGCASLTQTRKPMVDEKVEIKTVNGVSTTNTTTSVKMSPEFNTAGKCINGGEGFIIGLYAGAKAGHQVATTTPGMENASVWQKTGNYFSCLGEGIWKGATIGAKYGYNRSLQAEEKAAEAEAMRKFAEAKKAKEY